MNKISAFPSLLIQSIKWSLNNIWRNKFLSIATIFVIGVIIFIFNAILAINFISKNALSELNKKIDIVVYIKESATYTNVQNIMKEIETFPGVDSVTYTSKEDALTKIKQTHPDIPIAFEKYNLGNPLPASINIKTTNPEYNQQIEESLNQDKFKAYLSNIITGKDSENSNIILNISKNLLEVTNFANQIIFWLVMIFVIGGSLIIFNAIQITIFNRKKEINVMKLVGAPYYFIRMPFIIESAVYGILAVILSFVMILVLANHIEIKETSLWDYYSEIKFYKIFIVELLATIILSILSALLAIHEYLQKRLLED